MSEDLIPDPQFPVVFDSFDVKTEESALKASCALGEEAKQFGLLHAEQILFGGLEHLSPFTPCFFNVLDLIVRCQFFTQCLYPSFYISTTTKASNI